MPYVDSDFSEVPGPHHSRNPTRELYRVFRGRFCFPLGIGVHCGAPTQYAITAGQTKTLQLSISPQFITLTGGVEYTHTFEQQIGPWPAGSCDSIEPVLCFSESELRLYRWRKLVRHLRWEGITRVFDPRGARGSAYPNHIRNDPNCDCHDGGLPTAIDSMAIETAEQIPRLTTVQTTSLTSLDPEEYRQDPELATAAAAEAFEDAIRPDDDGDSEQADVLGFIRSDGRIVWLNWSAPPATPNIGLIPWGTASLQRRQLTAERTLNPVIVVGPAGDVVRGEIRVLVAAPAGNELQEYVSDSIYVRSEARFSLGWWEVDFRDLPADASGLIEVELYDSNGVAVGFPAREPFAVDPLPLAIREPASV